MFTAWPKMDSSSVCFLLHYHISWPLISACSFFPCPPGCIGDDKLRLETQWLQGELLSAASCQTIGGCAFFSKIAGTESEGESAVILSIKCHLNQFYYITKQISASQVALVVKNLPTNAGDVRDVGSVPGSGRSPGEGNGNPLQYPCLENPMDRGAWWAIVHGVVKSQTRLSGCIHKQILVEWRWELGRWEQRYGPLMMNRMKAKRFWFLWTEKG